MLVTGATGFLGSHLVDALVKAGAEVAILRRDRRPPTPIIAGWLGAVTIVDGDLADGALLERVLEELSVRTVFHVAAQTQVGVARRRPAATFSSNIAGTWTVLEAVRRSPSVEQVLLASSDKAYGVQARLPYDESMPLLAQEPYDVSKACAEMLGVAYQASYGTPVAITRCANFYGPGDRNWRRLVPGTLRSVLGGERPVIRSDGSPLRDYLYVKDGVSAYLRLAEAMADNGRLAGQSFNFSAEQPLTVLEMVQQVQKASGTSLEPYSLNEGLAETVDYYREILARG